jgi:hypothetical protein
MIILGTIGGTGLAVVASGLVAVFLFVPRKQDAVTNSIFLGIITLVIGLAVFFFGIAYAGRYQQLNGRRKHGTIRKLLWVLGGSVALLTILEVLIATLS